MPKRARTLSVALLSLAGASALLAPPPAAAAPEWLATPEAQLRAMRRIQCSEVDGEPAIYYWQGYAYSRVAGEPDKTLFRVEGMNIRACGPLANAKSPADFRLVSREILLYEDPVTGEVLREWPNPWTGKKVTVVHVANDPVNGPIFSTFMRAYSSINREAVARHSVFSGPVKILDLGGGDGDLSMAIATHHPEAQVTVADLPVVIERTSQSFSSHPHASRLQTVGVDLLQDPLPGGYDIILCAHVIDILSPEEISGLLAKARAALAPKGKLVVFTPVTSDHGRGPLINSLMGIYFLALARGKGRFYSTRKLREIAADCGFKAFRDVPLPCDEVLLIAEKGG